MKTNYDPYKRTILFFLSLLSVILMTSVFAYFWYNEYTATMYAYKFYRRGNYAMIALYGFVLYVMSSTYGALKIGQLRRVEVLLSQFLASFLANIVMYIVICLLAFGIVNPNGMLIMQAIDFAISAVWTIFASAVYNRVFQPWKILLVYGERPAADLVYKVEKRRDKYAIYDAINIDEGLEKIAKKAEDFQAIIIGDIAAEKRNEILKYCYGTGIRAYIMPKISDIIMMGTDQIHVFDTPFLLTKGYSLSFDQRVVKRVLDLAISIPFTIVALPFMLLVAIAIKINDRGPVLYKQTRVTKDNKTFEVLKFRSMIVNAESGGKAVLAKENDERITKVGKFIRATRMDELPQLFNVLKGEMSLVGPRPERPEIIEEYKEEMPEFGFRTRVKAGLTGFAQIYGKYNTVPYDKLKLDLFYIENYSIWTDLKLIMMTVKTILKPSATEGIDDEQETALKNARKDNVEDILRQIVEEEKNK